MFAIVRLLFIIAVVWLGYAGVKYRRSGDRFWWRMILITIWVLLVLLAVLAGWLILDRLAH
ncbi:hypothetical protein SAMN02745857_02569 [Andreprevotia lacus DSM 23236]|jgi:hypothetical protein|uniref:Uncharacterized protein n=1 Tax=Andreprevotia lacus DSM 23236 TaxID=1121001 RepID=A0A1W1XS32_9NEIS|nr:hypothetical protein [Andreprevotia lacus]SMC26662.1 hypothetical protein SAMN02745857_02569 [Andreprevotia lacus DSM 23236]